MTLHFTNKKIGIWGFGVSGKATLGYIIAHHLYCTITVIDKKLDPKTTASYQDLPNVFFVTETPATITPFLTEHDIIITSPGIDLRPYKKYSKKFLAEIDLFFTHWNKTIIAITGTLGKTSITHLLDVIMRQNDKSLATGGNIGIGMTELLTNTASCALLELSSFQLEHAQKFAPDCAIITNLYPNHLDRHETMQDYWNAKRNILLRQKKSDLAIIPLALAELIRNEELESNKKLLERPFVFTHPTVPTRKELNLVRPGDSVFYYDQLMGAIMHRDGESKATPEIIVPAELIPTLSYPINWVIIAAFYTMLGADAAKIFAKLNNLSLPDYRLDEVTTIHGVTYYNDSKSTIINASIAAVKTLNKKHGNNIILLLGGTSKGVDRTGSIKELKEHVAHIVCFGAEAKELLAACKKAKIPADATTTLEEAITAAKKHAVSQAAVVFSPGGASFDLFKDYKERGEKFKQVVLNLSR